MRGERCARLPRWLVLVLVLCAGTMPARATAATVAQPNVVSRAQWGADESLRLDSHRKEIWPRQFWPIQKIIVHHTETQNNDPDPAATIRTIYRNDARLQGLGDISYNFLIDEEGRIYEGRYSRSYARGEIPTGEDLAGNGVAGGHSRAHNSGTVGIAMLGGFSAFDVTPRARVALERLVAWISATHDIDPLAASLYTNPATGLELTFPNIAGHRDVNPTECPGAAFYATLSIVRSDVAGLLAGRAPAPVPKRTPPRLLAKPQTSAAQRRRRRESRAIDRVRAKHPIVFSGGGRRREVALAFHGGPGPYTPQVVAALAGLHAPATFFDIGNAIIYFSGAAAATHDQGFEIGNLTESFTSLTRLSSLAQRREILDQAARVRSLGIPSPRIVSPPYGVYNRGLLSVLGSLRLLMVLWSVDSRDDRNPGTQAIVRRVLRDARRGSIILLHDAGGDRTQTLEALPAIVNGLRSHGYRLVTIPRLLVDDPPRP